VIKKIHDAKTKGENTVEIWGDGTARREFMYAEDLADCIYECVKRFDDVPQLMNVGLGVDYSINDYYAVAAKVLGYQGTFKHDTTKPVGMKRKLVDVSRVSRFGWKSRFSLEEGLKRSYEYFLTLKGN
jgi:GDP-L-fucose synthase